MLDSTNSNPDFMNTIITGDESWIYGYNPENPLFSLQGKSDNSTKNHHSNAACHQLTLFSGMKKFVHANEGSRSLDASVLH